MNGRAQTEFDYVIGMTLVLLTLTGVFTFVPTIYEPFEDPVDTDKKAAADKMAADLITASAVDGTTNTLDNETLHSQLQTMTTPSATGRFNVTLQNGSDVVPGQGGGSSYVDNRQPTATTVRIVTLAADDDSKCDPVCRLVVRVW